MRLNLIIKRKYRVIDEFTWTGNRNKKKLFLGAVSFQIFRSLHTVQEIEFGRYESKITIPIQKENRMEKMLFSRDRIRISTDRGSIFCMEEKGLTYVERTVDFCSSGQNCEVHLMDLHDEGSTVFFFQYKKPKVVLILRSTGKK